MKYFLLLVQGRGAKIPAPVLEVVALAAAPPPYLSVVLLGMFDCESRCFASEVPLSDTSYFLVLLSCTLWLHKFLQSFWQHLLSNACPQKSQNKNMFLRETLPGIKGEPRCFAERSVLKDAQHIGHPECSSL